MGSRLRRAFCACLTSACGLAFLWALTPHLCFAAHDLLLLEPDGRAAARGESALALAAGIGGWHQQPAALALQEGGSVVLDYLDHVQDLRLVGTSWGSDGAAPWKVGLSLVHLDFGLLEGLDENGVATGSFDAGETLILAGVGRKLPPVGGGNLHAGVQAGWLSGRIDDARSQAFLVNGGMMWRRGQLSLGAALRNAGVVTKTYGSHPDELPRVVEAGAAWRLAHLPFTWSLAWQRIQDRDPLIKVGGEFEVAKRWRLGLGYHVERGDERLAGVDGEASRGFSAGLGAFLPGGYDLQWSWTSFGELGSLHRLGLAWQYRP